MATDKYLSLLIFLSSASNIHRRCCRYLGFR